LDFQTRQAHRQPEPPRPGAARIHVKHALALANFWLVGVAGDHHPDPGGGGVQVQFLKVVAEVDQAASYLHGLGDGQPLGPGVNVHVAPDRDHGRDGAQ